METGLRVAFDVTSLRGDWSYGHESSRRLCCAKDEGLSGSSGLEGGLVFQKTQPILPVAKTVGSVLGLVRTRPVGHN